MDIGRMAFFLKHQTFALRYQVLRKMKKIENRLANDEGGGESEGITLSKKN